MARTSQKRVHRRALDRHGWNVTLTNYEKTGEDDFGENWDETAGSPYTITAYGYPPGSTAETARSAREADADVDRVFDVKDNTTAAGEIRDGGGEGASEITDDGHTYYVVFRNDQKGGLYQLFCTKD